MLSEPQIVRLRHAISARLRDPSTPDGELRSALDEVAVEARARSIRPEELIVALKTVLAEAASGRFPPSPEEQRRVQEWLVTTCIQAYFGKR